MGLDLTAAGQRLTAVVSWDSPRKIDDPSWFIYVKARSRANFRHHDYHRERVDWEVEAYRRDDPDQEEAIQLYKEAIECQVARAGFFAGGVTLRNDVATQISAMHGKNAITVYIDLAIVHRVHKAFDLAGNRANSARDIHDRYPMHVQEEPKMLTLRSEASLMTRRSSQGCSEAYPLLDGHFDPTRPMHRRAAADCWRWPAIRDYPDIARLIGVLSNIAVEACARLR